MQDNKEEKKEEQTQQAATSGPQTPPTQTEQKIEVVQPQLDEKRRKFIVSSLHLGWAAFTASCLGGSIATFRFMYTNTDPNPPQIFKLGKIEDYIDGSVDDRWKQNLRIWIIKDGGIIYALRAVCTHLGCSPNWLEFENKFKCPCHGSGFRKDGKHFEGPAPRPLERVKIFLAADEQITVDLKKTYRYELGQWKDEDSFIKL